MIDSTKFILIFLVSFSICGVLVVARNLYMPLLRSRDDIGARQALHCDITPRLGGVGIILAAALAMLIIPQSLSRIFGMFAISLVPVVLAGLAEDLGYRVAPRGRLLAAASSCLFMIFMLNVWVAATGVAALDSVLRLALVAIPVTMLWCTGICHGFNLIDGVNGLTAGLGIVIATGLWWIARENGQDTLALFSFALIPALLGFILFNWPFGRIFLGDAGAYGIGHILVWLSILLALHVPEATVMGLSLMFFWPAADTLLAMHRRWYQGKPVDAPDRMHFHQFTYRLLSQFGGNKLSARAMNSLTGLVILPFAAMPVVAAVMLYDAPYLALAAWAMFGALFVLSYVWGVRVFKNRTFRPVRPFKVLTPAE